jgi:hypothetical protein
VTRARSIWTSAAVLSLLLLTGAPWPSRPADLRRFDPKAVARIETSMWRSYYGHKPLHLFGELSGLMREQYGMSWFRAKMSAYHAARAAVKFHEGSSRPDYERALPDSVEYYRAIRSTSATRFDVHEAARRELEWWIVHRERDRYGKAALIRSLASLQECLYQLPAERFQGHAAARAEAMLIRDTGAAEGGVTEADWLRIAGLLDQSWTVLWQAVQPAK